MRADLKSAVENQIQDVTPASAGRAVSDDVNDTDQLLHNLQTQLQMALQVYVFEPVVLS